MTLEDLKLLVEKHHESIIHDIEALILEYNTRPLPKTGYKYKRNIYDRLKDKEYLSPNKLLDTTLSILNKGDGGLIFIRKKRFITIDSTNYL